MKFPFLLLVLTISLLYGCGGEEGGETSVAGGEAAGEDSLMEVVLARVGDHPITYGDVYQHMLSRSGPERVDQLIRQPDVLQVALASLVDQFVWAEVAKMEGMGLTRAERRQVEGLESQLLSTRYVGDVIQAKAMPEDADIQEFYNQNQSRYLDPVRIGARHILVGSRAEAEALKTRAEQGEDFGKLARENSQDEATRDLGGALGFVSAGKPVLGMGNDSGFQEAILTMDLGQIKVYQSGKGWHVIKAEKKEGGDLVPLEEVREEIQQLLVPQKFGKVYQVELAKARERTDAEIDEVAFGLVTGTKENTGRMMITAKQQADTRGKIELYRRVAYDFPSSKYAAEAQFRMAYHLLVDNQDQESATRELNRLKEKFSKSRYVKAADYLLENIDMDPEMFGTAEDVMKAAGK